MKKILIILLFIVLVLVFAENKIGKESYNPNIDCIILEDENSIICKFSVEINRKNDQTIDVKWIDPNGQISRSRDIVIPAGNASAYDFRYLHGRQKGEWKFVIYYKGNEYSSKFEIK